MWSKISTDINFKNYSNQQGFLSFEMPSNTSASAQMRIPISVLGNGQGKTIIVAAGMHGDEYEGQVACRNLIRDLQESDEINGRIIIIPSVNMPACIAALRFSPIDGKNMLNCFSNNPVGSVSEIIGHYLENFIFPEADIMIDLHSGGRSLLFHPVGMAFHPKNEEKTSELSMELLNSMEFDYAEIRSYNHLNPDYILNACNRSNLTYVATELGGGESFNSEGSNLGLRNIYHVLNQVGVYTKSSLDSVISPTVLKLDRKKGRINADTPGIFHPWIKPGQEVDEGQTIGEIFNIRNLTRTVITTSISGVALAMRAIPITQEGDCLFEIASH